MVKLDRILEVIGGLLGLVLIAGVFLNFTNAVLRYGFGISLVWAEEIMIFGLIFIVMAGVIIVTARAEHLRIDVMIQIMPPRAQRLLRGLASLIVCAVFAWLAWNSLSVVQLMFRLGQTSVAARIPMWIPHGFLLVSFSLAALMAARLVVIDALGLLRGRSAAADGKGQEQ